jgi:Sulfotransferase family
MSEALPLPNLLLAGVGKAGTTSLFWYLSQHPGVGACLVKEPRYFVDMSETEGAATGVLPPIGGYSELFAECGSSQIRMEATPHYFHGGQRLVESVRGTLPDVRVVLTLREPAERNWSIYRFAKSMMLLPRDLEYRRFVDGCFAVSARDSVQTPENRPYWSSLRGSEYEVFIRPWLAHLGQDRVKIVFFDDIARDTAAVVRSLCTWLGLETEPVSRMTFSHENRTVPFRYEWLQRLALRANSERLLRDRRQLKRPARYLYHKVNRGRDDQPDAASTARLRMFFEQPNGRLRELLRQQGYVDIPDWVGASRMGRGA